MDQVFSKENKTLKKYWKIGKNTGKVREFCQSGKVGTLITCMKPLHEQNSLKVDTVISKKFIFIGGSESPLCCCFRLFASKL